MMIDQSGYYWCTNCDQLTEHEENGTCWGPECEADRRADQVVLDSGLLDD